MKEQLKKMKPELKEMAQQIKNQKSEHKQKQREFSKLNSEGLCWSNLWRMKAKHPELYRVGNEEGSLHSKLHDVRRTYRHKHIAYCLLRGRTLEQIEGKNREGNKPDMRLVEKFKKEVQDAVVQN